MTGFSDHALQARDVDFDHYLVKPVGPKQLCELLQAIEPQHQAVAHGLPC